MEEITKPSFTRLARKAGVKSLSENCFPMISQICTLQLKKIIDTALIINSGHQKKTIMVEDIYGAMSILGHDVAHSTDLGTK